MSPELQRSAVGISSVGPAGDAGLESRWAQHLEFGCMEKSSANKCQKM